MTAEFPPGRVDETQGAMSRGALGREDGARPPRAAARIAPGEGDEAGRQPDGGQQKITREQMVHLASLARLELGPAELDAFAGQLDDILQTVKAVGELADAAAGEQLAQQEPWLFGAVNVLRADEPLPSLPTAEALAAAPASQDGKFVVPRILGEEP